MIGIKILANNHLGLWIGELRPLPWIDLVQLLPGSELKTSNSIYFVYRKSWVKWQQVLLLNWYPTKGVVTHKHHGMSATPQVVQCATCVAICDDPGHDFTEQGWWGGNPLKKHRGNFLAQQMLHTLQRPRINQDEQNWTYILAFWYITMDSRTMCVLSCVWLFATSWIVAC